MTPQAYLQAMRAETIPEGESGLWAVRRITLTEADIRFEERLAWVAEQLGKREKNPPRFRQTPPPGTYTQLLKATLATVHNVGECVMNDYPGELLTHLDFVVRAHGRVLVTGLGLGCVVRGLLVNPRVTDVTVVEREHNVLKLVEPHMPAHGGLRVIQADAFEFARETRETWDCAWHDVWNDPERGEPHLQKIHTRLLTAFHERVGAQGAWDFPRFLKRFLRRSKTFHLMG